MNIYTVKSVAHLINLVYLRRRSNPTSTARTKNHQDAGSGVLSPATLGDWVWFLNLILMWSIVLVGNWMGIFALYLFS